MFSALRRAALAGVAGSLLLAGPAGSAFAYPPGGGGGEDGPVNCGSKVSGSMTASTTSLEPGSTVTIGWTGTTTAACAEEVSFKVGTSFSTGSYVAKTGSRSYSQSNVTTYHLYADFGDHYSSLASKTVYMKNQIPVTVDVQTLRVDDAQEEGGSSNGDEPYLIVAPLFADGSTVDFANLPAALVRNYLSSTTHENVTTGHAFDGASFTVPASTGEFRTTMKPWRNMPVSMGKDASLLGLIVVALDEDATSDAVADKVAQATAGIARLKAQELIRTATIPDAAALQQLLAEIQQEVRDYAIAETLYQLDLPGIADPDDVIGTGFQLVRQSQIENAQSIPVNMSLVGNGANYVVQGSIRRG